VYTLSLDDVKEIFDIKLALECMMARRAAECQDQALRATLAEALEAMKAAAEANNPHAWYEVDIQLHRTIFRMGGNERVIQIIQGLNDQWHRLHVGFLMIQGRIQRSTVEHIAFVESILEQDADEAEHRMCTHIENLRNELVSTLVNVVLPFVNRGI
jgi:DNA-binding GntR family transcriptional regulator